MAGPYYTTATLVRKRLLAIDPGLTDADILVFIAEAESTAEMIANTTSYRASFDADKFGIMRRLSSNLAAIQVMGYDVTEFSSVTQASLTADILWAQCERDIAILTDVRNKKYLDSLV